MKTEKLTLQQQAYKGKGAAVTKLNAEVNKAAIKIAEDLIKGNPEYNGLAVMPLNRAYIQGPKGVTKVIMALADALAQDRTGKKKQVDITKAIQTRFPDFPIPKNIWQKQLSGPLYKKVEQRIHGNMAKPISIKGCKTLAQVKKRVNASIKTQTAVVQCNPIISLSRENVIVNGITYPVLQRDPTDSKSLAVRVLVKKVGKQQVSVSGLD